jgi:hypothetical protein
MITCPPEWINHVHITGLTRDQRLGPNKAINTGAKAAVSTSITMTIMISPTIG